MVNRTTTNPATVTLTLSSIGFTTCTARNLWTKTNLGSFTTTFAQSLATHASGLYKLTGPATGVSAAAAQEKILTPQERTFRCTGETFVFPAGYERETVAMAVYDLGGKLVKSSTFSKRKSVDLKTDLGVPKGSYIVKLEVK